MQTIFDYLERTKNYSTFHFILEISILAFFLKMLFIILFGVVFSLLGINVETSLDFEEQILKNNLTVVVLLITLFASFETLTGQWLMIWLISKFSKKIYLQVLISALVFSLLHVEPLLIAAVFPIGVLLAFSFIIYRRISRWKAFWVTTLIHINHNLFVSYLLWLSLKQY